MLVVCKTVRGGAMSKNVTLRMDEGLLKKCRHAAVEQDMSLSQWVTDVIARTVERDESRDKAKRDALRLLEKGFSLGGKPLSREEAHER
jgi:hypothetical protein